MEGVEGEDQRPAQGLEEGEDVGAGDDLGEVYGEGPEDQPEEDSHASGRFTNFLYQSLSPRDVEGVCICAKETWR